MNDDYSFILSAPFKIYLSGLKKAFSFYYYAEVLPLAEQAFSFLIWYRPGLSESFKLITGHFGRNPVC